MVECAHMNKRGGADFQAVGFPAARADDVEPQLPLVRFGPAIDLSRRGVEALREELELLDHGFQIRKDPLLRRQRDAGYIGHNGAVLHLLQALPDDFHAFIEFLDADPVPIVGVAVLAERHTEFAFRIGRIGLGFTEVVVDTGAAERRPAQDRNSRRLPPR